MMLAHCTLDGCTGHEAGRALLARLYREATGEPLPPIAVTERGKPYFPGKDWHFSISHTKKHAFCVLSRENVAIDAEEADRKINLKLADRILSPGEMAQFRKTEDPQTALLTFWVLKECAAKLSGEGLRGFPNGTDFSLEDPRVQRMAGCLVAIMTESQASPMGEPERRTYVI